MAFLVHSAKKLSWFGLGGGMAPLDPPLVIGQTIQLVSEGQCDDDYG